MGLFAVEFRGYPHDLLESSGKMVEGVKIIFAPSAVLHSASLLRKGSTTYFPDKEKATPFTDAAYLLLI